MKQYAKKSDFSLVTAEANNSATEDKGAILTDSFDSWVNSVAPTVVRSAYPECQANVSDRFRRRSLTLNEVTRVNYATVREGTEHRHWPPEVVLSFLAADVIKRKQR